MLPSAEGGHLQTDPDTTSPLGRIVSVSGSQSVVLLHSVDQSQQDVAAPAEMGTLVKIETPGSIVLGLVSALTVPVPSQDPTESEMRIIELEFVGELPRGDGGALLPFRRGISAYPALGDQVYHASNDILAMAYACDGADSVKLGTIVQEHSIPAMAKTDDLLGKHLAILGSTGTGKSCSVALLLRNILQKTPNAHLVLLDPHREYEPAFKGLAEVINSENLTLPFWLLTFEEITEILIGTQAGRETDIETLREMIPLAKARYGANQRRVELRTMLSKADQEGVIPSVDTPVPYRISDLIALLEEQIGKLDLRGELAPFKRLKSRLETISRDPRYSFMFGSLTVQDTMADVLGRIFRVPVNGKPITIFELTGLPSEIINVVVSVLSRMTFDFAMWSAGQIPITLVCEEAHRYAPANSTLGFEPAKRALAKIAKEGRKYGVSLCIISQRPAELDSTILSQCATIICMRLTNEKDQEIARARVSDGSASLLDVLPSLATGEAVAFGEGVALPTRIRFDRLPPDAMPRGSTARFSEDWQRDIGDADMLHHIVDRWRAQSLGIHGEHDHGQPAAAGHEELERVVEAAADHAVHPPAMHQPHPAAAQPEATPPHHQVQAQPAPPAPLPPVMPQPPQQAAPAPAPPTAAAPPQHVPDATPAAQPVQAAAATQPQGEPNAMEMARAALEKRTAAEPNQHQVKTGTTEPEPQTSRLGFRPTV